jgi:hypothetical protein
MQAPSHIPQQAGSLSHLTPKEQTIAILIEVYGPQIIRAIDL